MLGLELGQILILALGFLLVMAGFYGLVPLAFDSKSAVGRIRIREKDLATVSPPKPLERDGGAEASQNDEMTASVSEGDDGLMDSGIGQSTELGLIEELFAELLMLRSAMAELTTEVHSLRDESRRRQARSRVSQRLIATRPADNARRLRSVA